METNTELKMIHLSEVEAQQIKWLWYPFIPYGKLSIVQGDPGDGKSTLILNIAAKLSRGECIDENMNITEPVNVIYQTAEDGLADVYGNKVVQVLRKMLLSFRPDVYEKIKSGLKIFEHRRNFPDEPIMAYMYVSSPVKAITGIVYLDKRHCLSDWLEEYKEDSNAIARIKEYMETYHYRYAMEIAKFQETSKISLDDLRKNVPGFVAPQMYIYLDGTELLEYIESNLKMIDLQVEHSFERIEACQVCVH